MNRKSAMKKAFATVLTATLLLTSCTNVNESVANSVSETETTASETTTTVETTALFEKADQYPVFKVAIKGSFLRSESEYGENIIASFQEGDEVIVLKEHSLFSHQIMYLKVEIFLNVHIHKDLNKKYQKNNQD